MQMIMRIPPREYVRHWLGWEIGSALRQQVSLLMLVAKEAPRGRIALCENDMPCDAETSLAPCGDERVGLMPAVETDAKAIIAQRAVDFAESWTKPRAVIVVGNGAAIARDVARKVGRIGQSEIDGRRWNPLQNFDAIAIKNPV